MKNDPLQEMLDLEYERTLNEVADAREMSDDAKWKLQKLSELQKMRINEAQAHDAKKDKRWDRGLKIGEIIVGIAGIVVPVSASCVWMSRGLKFETTGSYSSRTKGWIRDHFSLFKHK